jgi:glycosyltransferase involved in cell wall biosynthesis
MIGDRATGWRRPRIAMVSANAFPVMGGVETHIHEVAPRIARAGFDVTVITTDRSRSLPTREVVNGVPIMRVPAYPSERDYYLAPRVARLVAHGRWDLVHCQGYHTFVPPLAMLSAAQAGIPYILTFHSGGHPSVARNRLRGVQRELLQPLLAHARRLVAVSHFEAEFFAKELRIPTERFVTIRNGAAMAPPADPEPVDDDNPLILSVGRLERYKGHHLLIDALPHVLHELPGARLAIVGAGQFEAELRARAATTGLNGRIRIGRIDPLDRDGMARTVASASAVALLSEYEANPVSVMEALALGRRVLVADTSGLSELAREGLASAVPIDATPEQIARALVDLIRSPEPGALDLPTWDESATQLADVYREVLAG